MKSLLFVLLVAPSVLVAQSQQDPQVMDPRMLHLMRDGGSALRGGVIQWSQSVFNFNSQTVAVEKCVNIPILNATDRPRLLTALYSTDRSFNISSPAEEMLPMTIEPMGSMKIAVCFRPSDLKKFSGRITAVFGTDSTSLSVEGIGIKPVVGPKPPAQTGLEIAGGKKRSWVFSVDIAQPSQISLTVVDALGRTVRSLSGSEIKAAATYKFDFDGKDDKGNKLAAGTYYVKLSATDQRISKTLKIK